MTLEDGYHDVGGVLDGEIPGPGPDRGHREAREFPLARLFQRRAPRARHPVAGHGLGVASDHGVDHELRRQVVAGRTTAVAARNARSSTTTRITRRRPPASGDTSA